MLLLYFYRVEEINALYYLTEQNYGSKEVKLRAYAADEQLYDCYSNPVALDLGMQLKFYKVFVLLQLNFYIVLQYCTFVALRNSNKFETSNKRRLRVVSKTGNRHIISYHKEKLLRPGLNAALHMSRIECK